MMIHRQFVPEPPCHEAEFAGHCRSPYEIMAINAQDYAYAE